MRGPAFSLSYFASAPFNSLDLDVSDQSALRIRYTSNAVFTAVLALINTEDADPNDLTAGSQLIIDFAAGEQELLVPLPAITGTINDEFLIGGGSGLETDLPAVDLMSVDLIGLYANLGNFTPGGTPGGLIVSFSEIAFVPEPASLALFGLGFLIVGRRRG